MNSQAGGPTSWALSLSCFRGRPDASRDSLGLAQADSSNRSVPHRRVPRSSVPHRSTVGPHSLAAYDDTMDNPNPEVRAGVRKEACGSRVTRPTMDARLELRQARAPSGHHGSWRGRGPRITKTIGKHASLSQILRKRNANRLAHYYGQPCAQRDVQFCHIRRCRTTSRSQRPEGHSRLHGAQAPAPQ